MFELNEEMLMAYADGELDPQVMEQVEAALAKDPAARNRVRLYQRTTHLLQQAFDQPMREDLPERLLEAAGVRAEAQSSDNVISLATRFARRTQVSLRQAAMPIAASLALVIGTAVGYQINPASGPSASGMTASLTGHIDPSNNLHHALETARSGSPVSWTEGGMEARAVTRLTFKSEDGHFCRQYQVTMTGTTPAQATNGVACRLEDGSWRTEIAVSIPAQGSEQHVDSYVAATGGGDKALDAFLDRVMVEPALGVEEEARALSGQWR